MLLAASLAVVAPAKRHAPPPPAPTVDPQTAQIAAALRQEGLSPDGIRAIEAKPPGLQARLVEFRTRAGQIGQALAAAKAANDIERFSAAMRQGDALNAEIQRERTGQMLHMLATLSPADRAIFLRHIGPPAAASQGR